MRTIFECPKGHTHEVDDTGDAASEIATRSMRAYLKGGCMEYDGPITDSNRDPCGQKVVERKAA